MGVGIIMFSLRRNEMPRGCFIVFCGLDGSGKSTLMEGVRLWLEDTENYKHSMSASS
jgi:ABC-type lipoprotein export system ATPase subunit